MSSCLEEIGGSMEAILSAGLTGVVLAVVKAAVNLKASFGEGAERPPDRSVRIVGLLK